MTQCDVSGVGCRTKLKKVKEVGVGQIECGDALPPDSNDGLRATGESLVGDDKKWRWHPQSVSLELARSAKKRWYWLVRFEATPVNGGIGGKPPFLLIPVLMDGVAIKPELIPPTPQIEPKKRKRG